MTLLVPSFAPNISTLDRIVITSRADPHMWIECIVLGRVAPGKLLMPTAGLDVIKDDLSGDIDSGVIHLRPVREDRSVLGVTAEDSVKFEGPP
jgi:hypothetical protein